MESAPGEDAGKFRRRFDSSIQLPTNTGLANIAHMLHRSRVWALHEFQFPDSPLSCLNPPNHE